MPKDRVQILVKGEEKPRWVNPSGGDKISKAMCLLHNDDLEQVVNDNNLDVQPRSTFPNVGRYKMTVSNRVRKMNKDKSVKIGKLRVSAGDAPDEKVDKAFEDAVEAADAVRTARENEQIKKRNEKKAAKEAREAKAAEKAKEAPKPAAKPKAAAKPKTGGRKKKSA